MLALCEGLARGSPEAFRVSMELRKTNGAFGGPLEPMNGAFFLRQWRAWYSDEFQKQDALFLHEEDHSARVERHRALLDKSIEAARTGAPLPERHFRRSSSDASGMREERRGMS